MTSKQIVIKESKSIFNKKESIRKSEIEIEGALGKVKNTITVEDLLKIVKYSTFA